MNSEQIRKVLVKNKHTKKCFNGVYAYNRIPRYIRKKPFCIVVNSDPDNKPGLHWFVINFPKEACAEYFDSYGNQTISKNIIKKINKYSKQKCFIRNNKRLQADNSDVCGYYCCVFLYYRCRGISMQKFLNLFSSKKFNHNDKLILNLYHNIFKN